MSDLASSALSPGSPVASRLQSLAGRLAQTAKRPVALILSLDAISPNPQQPRKTFRDETLSELAESLRSKGLIEPVVVRAIAPDRYELLAGERRWRAARIAGLREIPAVVRECVDDVDALSIALIENLEREDMVPADEIAGVAELATKIGVQQAATVLGKTAQWVSKRKRIAQAPTWVSEFVADGATADIEALYELAKLADDDAAAARHIITTHTKGSHLRALIKATARSTPDDQPSGQKGRDASDARTSASPPGKRRSGTLRNVQPTRILSARRSGVNIALTTDAGELLLNLSPGARAELRRLLSAD